MTRSRTAVLLFVALLSGLFVGHRAGAEEAPKKGVCEVMSQGTMQKAADARAAWLNNQISQGRNHFVSDVPGIICAW